MDIKNEIARVRAYYENDALQKRFSALITGESGAGKTFLLRTARMPVHIDSFDPGGSKCLRKWIETGNIVVDTRWENEDPYNPTVFKQWLREIERRIREGYFAYFGTYAIDSASSWADCAMNYQLAEAGRPGEAPKFTRDYQPQKVLMVNTLRRLMNLPCDFILLGHLKMIEETRGFTKDGEAIKTVKWRFLTVGQATVTIPMQFDELYVLIARETASGLKRMLLTEAQGTYQARSRLKADGKLAPEEEPDIKALLKKIGLDWRDKEAL